MEEQKFIPNIEQVKEILGRSSFYVPEITQLQFRYKNQEFNTLVYYAHIQDQPEVTTQFFRNHYTDAPLEFNNLIIIQCDDYACNGQIRYSALG